MFANSGYSGAIADDTLTMVDRTGTQEEWFRHKVSLTLGWAMKLQQHTPKMAASGDLEMSVSWDPQASSVDSFLISSLLRGTPPPFMEPSFF